MLWDPELQCYIPRRLRDLRLGDQKLCFGNCEGMLEFEASVAGIRADEDSSGGYDALDEEGVVELIHARQWVIRE